MKFTVSRQEMVSSLDIVGRGVGRSFTLPVLSYVLFKAQDGQLEMRATNLETAVRWAMPVEVEQEGSVCVEYWHLYDWLKAPLASDEVRFTLTEKVEQRGEGEARIPLYVRLRCGRNSCTMRNVFPEEDFPQWPDVGASVGVEGEELASAVGRVAWACSLQDLAKPWLEGILIELGSDRMALVAADGYKMARSEVNVIGIQNSDIGIRESVVVSRQAMKAVAEVAKGQVYVGVGEGHVVFRLNKGEVVGTTIEGAYPRYGAVLEQAEDGPIVRRADRRGLVRLVKGASLFASTYVVIEWQGDEVVATGESAEVGDYRGVVEVGQGDSIRVALAPGFIKGALGSMSCDVVEFVMSESGRAVLLRGDSSHRVVIMPVEVKG